MNIEIHNITVYAPNSRIAALIIRLCEHLGANLATWAWDNPSLATKEFFADASYTIDYSPFDGKTKVNFTAKGKKINTRGGFVSGVW